MVGPSPGTTLKMPAGALQHSMISASFNPTSEVSSEGLRTTVLPQASAKATFFIESTTGKLKGEIAATTPSGRRIDIEIMPGTSEGKVSPWTRRASPAIERIKFETHRFARQQYTWFRLDDQRICWLDADATNFDDILALICRRLGRATSAALEVFR